MGGCFFGGEKAGDHAFFFVNAAMLYLAYQRDRLQPTEALFDSLSLTLAGHVPGVPHSQQRVNSFDKPYIMEPMLWVDKLLFAHSPVYASRSANGTVRFPSTVVMLKIRNGFVPFHTITELPQSGGHIFGGSPPGGSSLMLAGWFSLELICQRV